MSHWIKSNVTLENTTTSNPASMSVAQYGSTFKVGRKVSSTFRVHVQTVSFAMIVGSHVMVTDGNVKGVTAGDVVTQRFPVHCDQTRPGLSNLQPFRSSHRFYKIREERRSVIYTCWYRSIFFPILQHSNCIQHLRKLLNYCISMK